MQSTDPNSSTKSLLHSYGLNMTTVTWEDIARSKNSCWGPNISDMTLYSNGKNCNVIRRPNFADITVDHSMDNFYVTVGNEDNTPLRKIKLSEYLNSIRELTMDIKEDEKLLCSTQACVLNDTSNEVSFNVRLFNYQTTTENPAVLVIISTNEGTSAQVLDAKTTDVLFNKNGRSFDFVAERLKEERLRLGKNTEAPMTSEEKERNVIFVYQIPLVVPKKEPRAQFMSFGGYSANLESCIVDQCEMMDSFDMLEEQSEVVLLSASTEKKRKSKGFDNAMLRVSKNDKGEFKGLRGKTLQRDTNYPIRCTLQYYWLTDDMNMSEELVKTVSSQINKFYDNSENKSSLVTGDTNRPTEPKLEVKNEQSFFTTLLNKFI